MEIVFKVNLTNVEKEFGFTGNFKFEKSRISTNKHGEYLGIDNPLFFAAHIEKTSDTSVKISWPTVRQISFHDCKLQRIRQGAFKGNFIRKKIPFCISIYIYLNIKGLENVDEVFLCGNSFRTLEANIFEGLENVERIHMFLNRYLTSMSRDAFNNLPKLCKIDMYGSGLQSIDFDMFNSVPSLECLVIHSEHSKELNRENLGKLRESKKYSFYIF